MSNWQNDRSQSILPTTSKGSAAGREYVEKPLRIPGLGWIPNSARNHLIAMIGEFVGTVLFLFFAFSGTQVALLAQAPPDTTKQTIATSNPAQLLYIALSFGFSLGVNAWVFFRISGGLFNPAVNLGLCLAGALPWVRGGLLTIAQMLGSMVASGLVSCMFPGPLSVRTSLGGGTSITRGLFIEMVLTAELVFTIIMLAAEKHKATFIAPVGIGLALFIVELSGVYYTGGSVNPARSFGPAVATRKFEGYHWIYWLGPALGAILAAAFYKLIKMLEYETANPGQDATKPLDEETPSEPIQHIEEQMNVSRTGSRSHQPLAAMSDPRIEQPATRAPDPEKRE